LVRIVDRVTMSPLDGTSDPAALLPASLVTTLVICLCNIPDGSPRSYTLDIQMPTGGQRRFDDARWTPTADPEHGIATWQIKLTINVQTAGLHWLVLVDDLEREITRVPLSVVLAAAPKTPRVAL